MQGGDDGSQVDEKNGAGIHRRGQEGAIYGLPPATEYPVKSVQSPESCNVEGEEQHNPHSSRRWVKKG